MAGLHCNNSASNFRNYTDQASFDVTDLTWRLLVKPITAGVGTTLLSRGNGGAFATNGNWRMRTVATGLFRTSIRMSDGITYNATTTTNAGTGTWKDFVGRVDTSGTDTVKAYLNATEEGSTAIGAGLTIGALAVDIRLFQNPSGADEHPDAVAAELTIWNVALGATDITNLWNGGQPRDGRMIQPANVILCDRLYLGGKDIILNIGTDTGTLVAETANPAPTPYKAYSFL